jgi:Holliday junction resolvasome RuvABC endonuclease subunit
MLLALDLGSWDTGWAVFQGDQVAGSGIIGVPRRGESACSQVRLAHIVGEMEELAARWRPQAVVLSHPAGMCWRMPALELVLGGLQDWSLRHRLPLHRYTDQEVRRAVAGRERVSASGLACAMMALLGGIGQARSTREWEAIAAGCYHLANQG